MPGSQTQDPYIMGWYNTGRNVATPQHILRDDLERNYRPRFSNYA